MINKMFASLSLSFCLLALILCNKRGYGPLHRFLCLFLQPLLSERAYSDSEHSLVEEWEESSMSSSERKQMGDEKVKNEAMEIMGLFQVLPRLVVFDLDYTLWPFYCDCRSKRETPSMFPHARGILNALKEKGVDMAIASRSPTRDVAQTFIDKLGIKSLFVAEEIFSSWSHKTEHFQKIQQKTSVPYESMLFFDDENRNIESVSKMGVTSILVNDGVTLGAFRQGLTQFSQGPSSSKRDT